MIALTHEQRVAMDTICRRAPSEFEDLLAYLAKSTEGETRAAIRCPASDREVQCGRAQIMEELLLQFSEVFKGARGHGADESAGHEYEEPWMPPDWGD